MDKEIKCMFCGPSGIGKTTLAKYVSELLDIPFVSGSYSSMVPSTRDIPHEQMMEKPKEVLFSEEHKLIFERARVFGEQTSFVSDRSYIDNLAYFTYKLAAHYPKCEFEGFENIVRNFLARDCTHLIVMACSNSVLDSWKVEDNNKRILNPYFQWMISNIMMGHLVRLGMRTSKEILDIGTEFYSRRIKILILNTRDEERNKKLIEKFLK